MAIKKNIIKDKVVAKENEKIVLIIDTREMKDQSEKGFFQEKLT